MILAVEAECVTMETERNHSSYSREVEYPANCSSARAKKKHKEATLLSNVEQLFADYIICNGKKIKNNVLFHTDNINTWKQVICNNYTHIVKEGIGRGGRLTVCQDETLDTDNPLLTFTYYTKKGTVLIQGNEASLNSFEELFPKMKAEAERDRHCTNSSTVGDTTSEQEEENDKVVPEVTEPDLKPTTSPSGPAPPTPPKLLQQLRESRSLLDHHPMCPDPETTTL